MALRQGWAHHRALVFFLPSLFFSCFSVRVDTGLTGRWVSQGRRRECRRECHRQWVTFDSLLFVCAFLPQGIDLTVERHCTGNGNGTSAWDDGGGASWNGTTTGMPPMHRLAIVLIVQISWVGALSACTDDAHRIRRECRLEWARHLAWGEGGGSAVLRNLCAPCRSATCARP